MFMSGKKSYRSIFLFCVIRISRMLSSFLFEWISKYTMYAMIEIEDVFRGVPRGRGAGIISPPNAFGHSWYICGGKSVILKR